ncbi:MAG: hypothetical protein ACRC76_07585 [Proteocatella sp.]
MIEFIRFLKVTEKGQGMVEYGIIVALVVVIAVAVFAQGGALGSAITGVFTRLGISIGGVSP